MMLERYRLKREEAAAVASSFTTRQTEVDLWQLFPHGLVEIPQKGWWVYLFTYQRGEQVWKAYVGKSGRLRQRVADYHRAFQARAPDDRKLAFLQRWFEDKIPGGHLRVAWSRVERQEDLHKMESYWIKRLAPIGNAKSRLQLAEARAVEEAYRRYFAAYFEAQCDISE